MLMQSRYVIGWTILLLGSVLLLGLFHTAETVQAGSEPAFYRIALDDTPYPDIHTPGFTPAALGPDAIPERRPSLLVGASVIALVIVLGLIVHARQKSQSE
jgi:hypothetical protein